MKVDIIDILDLDDGGAILSMSVDREFIAVALQHFILQAVGEKCNDVIGDGEAPTVVDEEGSSPKSDQESKAPIGFCDADGCT